MRRGEAWGLAELFGGRASSGSPISWGPLSFQDFAPVPKPGHGVGGGEWVGRPLDNLLLTLKAQTLTP